MGGEVRGTEAGGKGTVQLNGAARGWNITIWGKETVQLDVAAVKSGAQKLAAKEQYSKEWGCQGLEMRFSELYNSGCYNNTFLWARKMRASHGRNIGVDVCQCFVPRRLRMWRSVVSWPQEQLWLDPSGYRKRTVTGFDTKSVTLL